MPMERFWGLEEGEYYVVCILGVSEAHGSIRCMIACVI
jgi:hypothetical protein